MRFASTVIIILLYIFQPVFGQTIKSINIEGTNYLINRSININIDFTSDKKPWCGLRVDWGNGKSQPVRVGHDGFAEGAPTSPIKVSNTYNSAGKYIISVKGELLVRGLTGGALPCEVMAAPVEISIVDPETDTKYIEKSWTSYLGALPPLHLKCMQVGLSALDIKYETRVESDQLVSMNFPSSKRVIEGCQTFVKAIHPKTNVACKVEVAIGFQDSFCDQHYGQQMDGVNFKTITIEEAIKLHIQFKSWILLQTETPDGKKTRLANEQFLREKEELRAREAEQQKEAELKSKKDAEEARRLAASKEEAAKREAAQLLAKQQADKKAAEEAANKLALKTQERQRIERENYIQSRLAALKKADIHTTDVISLIVNLESLKGRKVYLQCAISSATASGAYCWSDNSATQSVWIDVEGIDKQLFEYMLKKCLNRYEYAFYYCGKVPITGTVVGSSPPRLKTVSIYNLVPPGDSYYFDFR